MIFLCWFMLFLFTQVWEPRYVHTDYSTHVRLKMYMCNEYAWYHQWRHPCFALEAQCFSQSPTADVRQRAFLRLVYSLWIVFIICLLIRDYVYKNTKYVLWWNICWSAATIFLSYQNQILSIYIDLIVVRIKSKFDI